MSREPSATTIDATASPQAEGSGEVQFGLFWVHPERRFDSFAAPLTTFGRSDDCTHCLHGGQVSRLHARVSQTSRGLQLTDVGSRNGSYVNQERVTDALLRVQDVVRLGNWVGIVLALTERDQPLTQVAGGVFLGPAATRVHAQAVRAAVSQLPIVLCGETGSGKEVLATTIHRASGRSGALVAVNCAALPEGLAEAELFGYRKGAFTGANQPSPGHFRAAHDGTLLLDEIADLPLGVQAKLLRALEQRAVVPLGESMPVQVNLKVVAAGQEPLSTAVEAGRFRADLYARLRGVELRLPPLRARREEIVPIFVAQARTALAQQGLAEAEHSETALVSPELAEGLCSHDWPMNVRELVQVAHQLAVLYPNQLPWPHHLLPESMRGERSANETPGGIRRPLDAGERQSQVELLLRTLERTGGNMTRAAASLGISRQRAYRLLEGLSEADMARFRAGR